MHVTPIKFEIQHGGYIYHVSRLRKQEWVLVRRVEWAAHIFPFMFIYTVNGWEPVVGSTSGRGIFPTID